MNELFPQEKNEITKKKIYFSFILKYINSKELNVLIKKYKILKHIYSKELNNVYIYSLFYIYLKFQLFNKMKENKANKNNNKYDKKILSTSNYFKILRNLYQNQVLN